MQLQCEPYLFKLFISGKLNFWLSFNLDPLFCQWWFWKSKSWLFLPYYIHYIIIIFIALHWHLAKLLCNKPIFLVTVHWSFHASAWWASLLARQKKIPAKWKETLFCKFAHIFYYIYLFIMKDNIARLPHLVQLLLLVR